ncbi:MAG TPA: carbohydrate-binding protein [Ktedonobacteraceae bacterium]|nr:carbohydrate-binding protein [Ktedonobacteraceae bacterium]
MGNLVIRKLLGVFSICILLSLLFTMVSLNQVMPAHAAATAWSPNGVQYHAGDLVTFQGNTYMCLQPHTSQPGWDPVSAPSLWQLQSGQPTPTPTSTATPAPTPTSTATPTPTATPAPGAPAKPSISIQKVWDVGGGNFYDVIWSKWTGIDATSWQLLENGKVIHTESIAPNNGAQTATFRVTDKTYGVYSYQVVLSNSAGTTASDPQSYADGGASYIALSGNNADAGRQSLEITINQGDNDFTLSDSKATNPSFSLISNNTSVISYQMLNSTTLRIHGIQSGRSSLRITENSTGEVRYVGVRVRTASGQNPGMPAYVAIGSESEDIQGDLDFWHSYATDGTNKRVDIRYIYINGGPINGWRTWTSADGGRAISYVRESLKMGMIPFFVYYNIPDSSESYAVDKQHINDASYMQAYFKDLQFFLGLVSQEAGDEKVGIVLEPDFIGYMMQNSNGKTPTPLNQLSAQTGAAYSSNVLTASDPTFPNTITGLIQATNFIIHKNEPNALFGWQFNLWASPGVTVNIPSTGLMRITDSLGMSAGRTAITNEAQATANYYMSGGITSNGASFISVDKYGLDAVGTGSASDPASATWFWNADHWNNYLLYVKNLHLVTGMPVILWQIPVGHINTSQAVDPYAGTNGVFPVLDNSVSHYEDSAPTFFLGDTFQPGSSTRFNYFATNAGGDPKITTSGGNTITWGSHMQEARDSGIIGILFGPGVGASTDDVGSPPTDGYWWIAKAQNYYKNPVPLT